MSSDVSDDEGSDETDSYIHCTAKKARAKGQGNKRKQKYKDYKQFKTYQEVKTRETSKAKAPSVSLQFQVRASQLEIMISGVNLMSTPIGIICIWSFLILIHQ